MNKKLSIIGMVILMAFMSLGMTACKKTDDLVWTNDNAVYAGIKAGYEYDILNDVEGSFQSLRFRKVYVTRKNTNQWEVLNLLFILEEDEAENLLEVLYNLRQDERIYSAWACYDLPFETVDTRCIEKEKDTIAVGESMTLSYKGGFTAYSQPFDFGGLYVKPTVDKKYTKRDFPGIKLKYIEKTEDGWLYLKLKEENYFDVIKALDIVSRMPTMQTVKTDRIDKTLPVASTPIWEVSDPTIVKLETNFEDYGTVVVTGLKPGKVTVGYAGVYCEITVTE